MIGVLWGRDRITQRFVSGDERVAHQLSWCFTHCFEQNASQAWCVCEEGFVWSMQLLDHSQPIAIVLVASRCGVCRYSVKCNVSHWVLISRFAFHPEQIT